MTTTAPIPSGPQATATRPPVSAFAGKGTGSPSSGGLSFAALLQADEPESAQLSPLDTTPEPTDPDASAVAPISTATGADWLVAGWLPWQASGMTAPTGPRPATGGDGAMGLPEGASVKPGLQQDHVVSSAGWTPATPPDATTVTPASLPDGMLGSTDPGRPRDKADPLVSGAALTPLASGPNPTIADGTKSGPSAPFAVTVVVNPAVEAIESTHADTPIHPAASAAAAARIPDASNGRNAVDALAGPAPRKGAAARGSVTTQSLQAGPAGIQASATGVLPPQAATDGLRSTLAWVAQGRRDGAGTEPPDERSAVPGTVTTTLRADASGRSAAEPMGTMVPADGSHRSEAAHTDTLPTAEVRPELAETMADAMEELAGQLAYWAQTGTQRAQLTLDRGWSSPLSVNVVLDQGEVHVSLETDDPDVRAALSDQAGTMLERLLDHEGLKLGNWSVDAMASDSPLAGQTPGNGAQPQDQPEDTLTWGSRVARRTGSDAPSAPATSSPSTIPRTHANHRLDLFA